MTDQENFSESARQLFEITSRIDERIKIIFKKETELDKKIEYIQKNNSNLEAKLVFLEKATSEVDGLKKHLHEIDLKLKSIEVSQNGSDQRWRTVVNFIFQTIWVILTSYLLMKIGLTQGMGII